MNKPNRLKKGDTIGLIAPCYRTAPEDIAAECGKLSELGFKIKTATNIFSSDFGSAGTPEQRAADILEMFCDDSVNAILFSGGETSNEVLPLLNYEEIAKHPKIFCSYSDSTTPMNAITGRCGFMTMYGSALCTFRNLTDHNLRCFEAALMEGDRHFQRGSEWKIYGGRSQKIHGTTIGGYLANFALMVGTEYLPFDPDRRYILFLEDYTSFSSVDAVERYFAHISQSALFRNVDAVIFGDYDTVERDDLNSLIERYAARTARPFVKCADFGHGANNAIIPIGIGATLDLSRGELDFDESPVIL